jgi:ABC-2 type transport system permease protein
MSAATTRLARVPAGHYRLSQVTRMEWIKLRSLRSTIWILAATVASMIAIGILVMANTRAPSSAADKASFDPTNNVLAGLALGQLLIGVLGVLVMTGEYSSGMIRSTLAAIPNRPLVLAAKAAVFGAVTLAVGETVSFVAFLAGRAVLDPRVPHPAFGQPGVLRAVVMSGAYLCLIGLMGLGLGAIVRHTAGAIAALVGVLFVVPLLLAGITRGPGLAKYFPTFIAGNSLGVAKPVAQMLSPWAGFGVLCLYTAVVLGAGGWLLARRDA